MKDLRHRPHHSSGWASETTALTEVLVRSQRQRVKETGQALAKRAQEYYSLVVLAVGGVKCVKLNLTAPFCGSLMNEINRRARNHPIFGPRDKWVQMTSTQDGEYGSSNPRSCSYSRYRYRSRFSAPFKAVPIRNTRSFLAFLRHCNWIYYALGLRCLLIIP